MWFWFFIWIAIAVAVWVYLGLKFYNDGENTWNAIKRWLSNIGRWALVIGIWCLILGIVWWFIYLIYLLIVHIVKIWNWNSIISFFSKDSLMAILVWGFPIWFLLLIRWLSKSKLNQRELKLREKRYNRKIKKKIELIKLQNRWNKMISNGTKNIDTDTGKNRL